MLKESSPPARGEFKLDDLLADRLYRGERRCRRPVSGGCWIEAATLKLDDADMREIGAAIRATGGAWEPGA